MKKVKRVLIISARAGAGHLRAGAALALAFAKRHPHAEIWQIDALESTRFVFQHTFSATYETLARKFPKVWGLVYKTTERRSLTGATKKLVERFDRFNASALLNGIRDFDPDHVVCTHYLPAEVCAVERRNGRLKAALSVAFTDFNIHNMWVHHGVDHYFVATRAMALTLRRRGVGPAAIAITGIPIMPEFTTSYPVPHEMRRKMGLRAEVPCLLCMAGGSGLRSVDRIAKGFADPGRDVQVLAVAGRNERLRRRLQRLAHSFPGRITSFGFVDNMHELMAASNVAVTNSGGLTTSECLAMGLPMVIPRAIPGQEERNADYLTATGAAIRAGSQADLIFKVGRLLASPQRLAVMGEAARRAARPSAAYDIAAQILKDETDFASGSG